MHARLRSSKYNQCKFSFHQNPKFSVNAQPPNIVSRIKSTNGRRVVLRARNRIYKLFTTEKQLELSKHWAQKRFNFLFLHLKLSAFCRSGPIYWAGQTQYSLGQKVKNIPQNPERQKSLWCLTLFLNIIKWCALLFHFYAFFTVHKCTNHPNLISQNSSEIAILYNNNNHGVKTPGCDRMLGYIKGQGT